MVGCFQKKNRKCVGLALGGGVVRGMAHIGVLSVLDEEHIPIDYVAGSSVGAVVAALYCAGVGVDRITNYAMKVNWGDFIHLTWPARGFVSFDKLSRWIVAELGDLSFAELKTPCALMASDLDTNEPVKLCEGSVARAVQASCSVPGIVTPVEINGRLLYDGAVTNNLPVSAVREMGADYVIGVDIMAKKIRRVLGPLGYLWAALEIMIERSGGGIETADCLIKPDLGGKTYLRVSRRNELFGLGRKAAIEKIEEIKLALDMPAPRNYPHPRKSQDNEDTHPE